MKRQDVDLRDSGLRAKSSSDRIDESRIQFAEPEGLSTLSSRWNSAHRQNRRIAIFKHAGSEGEDTDLPPQFPSTSRLDRLDEFFKSNPSCNTTPMSLISPLTPEPRPGHPLPLLPIRSVEEPESRGRRIEFKNRLFKRSGHVRWDRFLAD